MGMPLKDKTRRLVNLTARSVANSRPAATPFYLTDTTVSGLALRVPPSGVKTWSVRYQIGRRTGRLTLGRADVLTLADARARAKAAIKQAGDGVDPAEVKQARHDADTVGDFAKTYIEKHAKVHKKSWKIDRMRLKIDVLPKWKNKLLRDITRRDVRALLDDVASHAPIVANRTRSLLSKFFNFAIEEEIIESNPVAKTKKPGKEQSRDRVLTADEIRAFWSACDALPSVMASAYKLRLITVQRPVEVFSMRWQDVDLDSGVWTIPKEIAKNKLAHRVPLSATALEILKTLRTEQDAKVALMKHPKPSVYVLHGARGKLAQAEAAKTFTLANFRGYDLRRTAASMMTSSGIQRLVVSKILNHAEKDITAVYDRHSYDAEKKIALDAWARTLTAIIEPKAADVLAFVVKS
jgi:integrase